MYECDELEVWNLTPGVPVLCTAQQIFNVVGRVKSPAQTERLLYSLNGGPEKLVFFSRDGSTKGCERLERSGDFNIDTILLSDLKPCNQLAFRVLNGLGEKRYVIDFPVGPSEPGSRRPFWLNLEDVKYPEQVGQVVDGKWHVSRDESGQLCLEVRKEDAGYDRVILFSHSGWATGYEITAKLCGSAWTGTWEHGVGLGFRWNPHALGDGTCLPTDWNTGVALYYYYSLGSPRGQGLRIALGVTRRDGPGRSFHHFLLGHKTLSLWRLLVGHTGRRLFPNRPLFSQMVPEAHYRFRLLVLPEKCALSVWRDGRPEPAPQVVVKTEAINELPQGSMGVIAHRCAIRIYEFSVSPV
jgi:hypothetical protein